MKDTDRGKNQLVLEIINCVGETMTTTKPLNKSLDLAKEVQSLGKRWEAYVSHTHISPGALEPDGT